MSGLYNYFDSLRPDFQPQVQPRSQPQAQPQAQPRFQPQAQPRFQPQAQPRFQPQAQPRFQPRYQPQAQPRFQPNAQPQKPDEQGFITIQRQAKQPIPSKVVNKTSLCGTHFLNKIKGESNPLEYPPCPYGVKCNFAHRKNELHTRVLPLNLDLDMLCELIHKTLAGNLEAVTKINPAFKLRDFKLSNYGRLISDFSLMLAEIQGCIDKEQQRMKKDRFKKNAEIVQKAQAANSDSCLEYLTLQKRIQFVSGQYTWELVVELSRRARICEKHTNFTKQLLIKQGSGIKKSMICFYPTICGHGIHTDLVDDNFELLANFELSKFQQLCLGEFDGSCSCHKRSEFEWNKCIATLRTQIAKLGSLRLLPPTELTGRQIAEVKGFILHSVQEINLKCPKSHLLEDGIATTKFESQVSMDVFSDEPPKPKATGFSFFKDVAQDELDTMIEELVAKRPDVHEACIEGYYQSKIYQFIKFDEYYSDIGQFDGAANLYSMWLARPSVSFLSWVRPIQKALAGVNLSSPYISKWINTSAYKFMSLNDFERDEQCYRKFYLWVKSGSRGEFSNFCKSLEPSIKRWEERCFRKKTQHSFAIANTEEIMDEDTTFIKGKKSKGSKGRSKYTFQDEDDDEEKITYLARYYNTFESYYLKENLTSFVVIHEADEHILRPIVSSSGQLFREYSKYYSEKIEKYLDPMQKEEYEKSTGENYSDYLLVHMMRSRPMSFSQWIDSDDIQRRVVTFMSEHPDASYSVVLKYIKLDIQNFGITWETFLEDSKAVCKWIDVVREFPDITFEKYLQDRDVYDKLFRTGIIFICLMTTNGDIPKAIQNYKDDLLQDFEMHEEKMNWRRARSNFARLKKKYEDFINPKEEVKVEIVQKVVDEAEEAKRAELAIVNKSKRQARLEKLEARRLEKEALKQSSQVSQLKVSSSGRVIRLVVAFTPGYDDIKTTKRVEEEIMVGKKKVVKVKPTITFDKQHWVEIEFTNVAAACGDSIKISDAITKFVNENPLMGAYKVKLVEGSKRIGFRVFLEGAEISDMMTKAFPQYFFQLTSAVDAFKNLDFQESFSFEFPQKNNVKKTKKMPTYINGSTLCMFSASFPKSWEPTKLEALSDGILATCAKIAEGIQSDDESEVEPSDDECECDGLICKCGNT